MKRMFRLVAFLIVFFPINTDAQDVALEYTKVTDELVTVNSTSSLSGYTRNKVEVKFPEKTTGYICRITSCPKGQMQQSEDLFNVLKKIPVSEVAAGASLAQFAIRNNDGSNVDAFIFNNTYDADYFYAKKDGQWSTCKSKPSIVNSCFYSNDCIGRRIFFGFRNNNIMQGLDVHLEVVAIVDKNAETANTFSYSFLNGSNQELSYSLSTNKLSWQNVNLRPGYSNTVTFTEPFIFFRIQTNGRSVEYKVTPEERHKIVWNTQTNAWDLTRY